MAAACARSDPQPLELVAQDHFGNQTSLVAGGGAATTIGYTSTAGGLSSLRLARHDPASPDGLVRLGDVRFLPGSSFTRLVVTDEAAAVTVLGGVQVVDLSVPGLPVEELPALGNAADLAVAGRWVLAAVEGDLVLVSRDAPLDTRRFTPSGAPTALLATQGVFLAFTTTGYVAIDPAAATTLFGEVTDPVFADIRDARADGASAVVAGPAADVGRSRVLRLDLADPAAPVVIRGGEVPGAFVAFAWDGGGTSVVAVHGDGDGADPRAFHQGFVLRERAEGFSATGVPLSFWSQSSQPLAAHADRLFAVEARGLLVLRIR